MTIATPEPVFLSLLMLLSVALLLGNATAEPPPPENASATQEPKPDSTLRAAQARRPVLPIINGSRQLLKVYWLKSDREQVFNGNVEPGQDTIITTTLTIMSTRARS